MKTSNVESFEADLASIHELIKLAHNPELAKVECDHVFQIWEDGEITMQKCGSLLWHRTLHRVVGGIDGLRLALPADHGVHCYAFVTQADAYEIGRQIVNLLDRYPQIDIAAIEVERYRIWMRSYQSRAA